MENQAGRREIPLKEAAMYFVLLAAAVLPYVEVVRHGYFLMDDFAALYIVKDLSLHDLFDPSFYKQPGNYYFFRPLGVLLWRANYLLYGFEPVGYHITNLLLYAACVIFIYAFLAELTQKPVTGFIGGLLFAVHPAHSELVGWISCRYDLIAGLFYIAGLFFYLKYLRRENAGRGFYAAALSVFILALLSKESAVTFPLAAVSCELFFRGEDSAAGKAVLRVLPFFVLAGVYLMIRYVLLGELGGYGTSLSDVFGLELLPRVLGNLKTLLLGVNLDRPEHGTLYKGAIGLSILIGIFFYFPAAYKETKKAMFFLSALVIIGFLPSINFSELNPDNYCKNPRYLFISSMGFAGAAALLLSPAYKAKYTKTIAMICASLIFFCYLGSLRKDNYTWTQKSYWSSTFIEQFMDKYPGPLDGFEIVSLQSPNGVFGVPQYKAINLKSALYFAYGEKEMKFKVDNMEVTPGEKVDLNRKISPGFSRKVIVTFDQLDQTLYVLYDSGAEIRPRI